MRKYIQASIIVACLLLYLSSVPAEQIHQLAWEDLVPAGLLADDPFAKLTPKQQELLIWVINTIQQLPKNGKQDVQTKEMADAVPELKKAGVNVEEVMSRIKEIQTAVVPELNGQHVRIPGYLLPLEGSNAKVTEFLLVPYVGACIHVPPPPPNQIIYVKAETGYDSKTLFEPVWVTGVISVKSMSKDLFLVDGASGIDIGYSMQAKKIEPYKE